MIITVKNLQQQTFTIEFDREKTVQQLKEKIYVERGPEYVVEKQKLIYAGIILKDDRTIASYNVDEKKFLVVMLKRDVGSSAQKPEEGAASTSKTPATSENKLLKETPKDKDEKQKVSKGGGNGSYDEDIKSAGSGGNGRNGDSNDADRDQAFSEPVGSATSLMSRGSGCSDGSETNHSTYSSGELASVFSNTSLQSRAESNLLMGEEFNRTVESMIEMGYCREMVLRALAASFNNPERAVEYLISGIPDSPEGFNAASAAVAAIGESVSLHSIAASNQDNNITGPNEVETARRPIGSERTQLPSPLASSENSVRQGEGCFGDQSPAGRQQEPGATGEDPFDFLRNQPQFVQMRSLVCEKPELLHAVLQQIGHTNPALLQLISENQDAFLSMLNRPVEGQSDDGGTNRQHSLRITPGRRDQLSAAARITAGGDGFHVHTQGTTPSEAGVGSAAREHSTDGGNAGADGILRDILPPRQERAAERRRAIAEAFMRERATAAAAVAALLAAPPAAASNSTATAPTDSAAISAAAPQDTSSIVGGNANTPPTEAMSVSEPAVLERNADGQDSFVIHLSAEDEVAVERLKALGFAEALVLQAYFACDKDEQLAANFLISTSFDD